LFEHILDSFLTREHVFAAQARPVKPARIWSPRTTEPHEGSDSKISSVASADSDAQKQSISVLLSRPIFVVEFNSLRMHVDAPKVVDPDCKQEVMMSSSGSDGAAGPWLATGSFDHI
jgi:hypothetical protein